MSEAVKTNLSLFEVEVEFVDPSIRLWLDRVVVVEEVYKALRKWGITVDDIEVIQTGKPSEQGVKFKIPNKRASFFFGAGLCRFSRDSTNWQTAEETIEIIHAALDSFVEHSRTKLKTFKTSVALHLQPETRPFLDILTPLIPSGMIALEADPVKAMATVIKWPHRRLTIDGSAKLANGIFIRYERDFPAETSFEDMAKQLQADEAQVFAMLDIAED